MIKITGIEKHEEEKVFHRLSLFLIDNCEGYFRINLADGNGTNKDRTKWEFARNTY